MKRNDKLDKIFFTNAALNYTFSAINIAANFFLFYLLVTSLGKEKFGIWATFLPIISFSSLIDLGIGNSVRNMVTDLDNKLSNKKLNQIVSKALTTLLFICSILILLFTFIQLEIAIDINNKLQITSEVKTSLFIFIITLLINAPLNIFFSVSNGLHKSYIQTASQLLYTIFFIILIYLFILEKTSNLVFLTVFFSIAKTTFSILPAIYISALKRIKIKLKKSNIDFLYFKKAKMFFYAQVLSLLFLTVDPIIISFKYGLEHTAEFALVSKIYLALINFFSILIIQYWSSVRAAFNISNTEWILNSKRKLIGFSLFIFFIGLLIAFFSNNIVYVWIGDSNFVENKFIFYFFSFYLLFHCVNSIFLNIQNALGELKLQVISLSVILTLYFIIVFFVKVETMGYSFLIFTKSIFALILTIINSTILNKLKS